ncbi:hypothetical protein QBC32DRAFT_387288 [Pseudoneurospora amorphoporcata]|uniref:Carbohydrate-binding module family 18 protein n=1 Tax=Pseudoneurospora amorphoporcata TaxID=241081 RepID=A0AAN6SAW0_9PEZI|nr:hypothetical protein QBC32DRAFT_387288 [Pseudoneurospora amorphoporcata]
MQLPHRSAWPQRLVFYLVALFYLTSTVCAKESECQPIYWEPGQFEKRDLSDTNAALNSTTTASASISSSLPATATSTSAALVPVTISPLINEDPQPGEINCRDTDSTEGMEINYYTCTVLAARNRISVDTLFGLNPGLDRDCGNIEADTEYCVRGFIEPIRVYDGLCGPPYKNATCFGTGRQCCNALIWRCGDSAEDCAEGTCYEGACVGDAVYSTDGTCGRDHGFRSCTGIWGDCCNAAGRCGTGPDFCVYGKCQLGNCDRQPTSSTTSSSTATVKTSNPVTASTSKASTSTATTSTTTKSLSTSSLKTTTSSSATKTGSSTTPSKSSTAATTITTKPPSTTIPGLTALPSIVVSSTVISFGSVYYSTAFATHTATTTGLAALPSCGQICFNNMVAQYSALGCASPAPSCLCKNANFGYGLRDCSNGACGTAVASSVIAYGSSYCASATAI